ncbi:MAG: hypothetical protein A2381_00925 [Bdellovibrionales bacterium RIFOXYB1_FULL_37_110]|nr:MAG: hypothetical protein A2417_01780 [Bdellovibrionales bacterium RIFOXYC1_FULL_37_79]OFZ58783.1 MAG: hypothetical protein A2381_00925 [Bdellovibrionales bacterium RIFOXYB1_FULL_37_110]OFZ64782.1 MAG: hypothetical protein A2577_06925 [Bdellovibrionales bacterium RIFOXYD1_FULL_36_51]
MANLINLPTFKDDRGILTVLDSHLDFEVKRIYYIYKACAKRGGHRHKKNRQAVICLNGSCEIFVNDGKSKKTFTLNKNNQCLILDSTDWHTMDKFSKDSYLLVLASEKYDVNDYIDEEYK